MGDVGDEAVGRGVPARPHHHRTGDDREQLQRDVGELEHDMQPSLAIYQEALEHGPPQIQMLAAYGLGMAYLNVVVRARIAIPTGGDIMSDVKLADRYVTLHAILEPMLVGDRERARTAFEEASSLADADPIRASSTKIIESIVAAARANRDALQPPLR